MVIPFFAAPFLAQTQAATIDCGLVRTSAPNLLQNPDFAQGFRYWTLEGTMGAGAAKMQLFPIQPEGETRPKSMQPDVANFARFQIWEISRQNRHLQFYQGGLNLEEGKPYTVSFWARADHVRPLTLQASVEDWHGIGLTVDNLLLTPEWRHYKQTFVATRTEKRRNRLTFVLGDDLGTVDITGIALQRSEEARPSEESPKQTNGKETIEDRIRPLLVGVWESHGASPARRFRFTFNADGTGSIQDSGQVRTPETLPHAPVSNPFRWYVGAKETELVVGSRVYQWTIHPAGQYEKLTLTDTQGKNRDLFRSPALVGVWESGSDALSQRYRYTFNADGTGSVQQTNATGQRPVTYPLPRAPIANPFRWYVGQGNRHIVIGSRTYRWTIAPAAAFQRLTLIDPQGKTRILYRQ